MNLILEYLAQFNFEKDDDFKNNTNFI